MMPTDLNPANTPLLLIAWRRPHTLRQVIDAIRPVAPTRLYVACDGPNPDRSGEAEKVAATRQVIDQEIDWPCQIERLYSDVNQGCRLGVSRAITWFFEQVEEGIILEDDCVPHPDFFPYCTTLLERYRQDTRVWCISGSNFQNGQWRGDGSYYFSRYPHCWGWACWRRAWSNYDDEMKSYQTLLSSALIKTIFDNKAEADYRQEIWQELYYKNNPNTWDYRWSYACFVNGALAALPNVNLVANVGFGADATHTISGQSLASTALPLFPLVHPTFILRDYEADSYTYLHVYDGLGRESASVATFLKKVMFRAFRHVKAIAKTIIPFPTRQL